MPAANTPVIVIEDDPFLRVMQVVLDPDTSPERVAAFTDFFSHDEPDFGGYCEYVRALAPGLFPARVILVDTPEQLRAALPEARAVVLESLALGPADIAAAPLLKAVQKYGVGLRTIDTQACAARGIGVLTIRRRANIACAEHVFCLMLAQAKMMKPLMGKISPDQLGDIGFPYRPFDRRHTPNSNWGRIRGVRMLNDATLGIVGFGEIGREIALRGNAFGMHVLYYQRTRLPEAEERQLHVCYVPLETLLAESDWLVPQLPGGAALKNLIGRAQLARMKPGAFIVNVSRPDVVSRDALIEVLRAGRLGGFALDPQYEAPGRSDDELLQFDNVILTPHVAAQPRYNALSDFADMIEALSREVAS